MTRLLLYNVSRDTAGVFRCEVSTEAPNFYTVVNSLMVTVAGTNKMNDSFFLKKVSILHWFVIRNLILPLVLN